MGMKGSSGRIVRGILLSNEIVDALKKEGITGIRRDLIFDFMHLARLFHLSREAFSLFFYLWDMRH